MSEAPKSPDSMVVREALQARLLVELMSGAMKRELVLKGGMAMRAVHGSTRYTKDIDLDADSHISVARVQGIVRNAIERALRSKLIVNPTVTHPKHSDTTLRWKIFGFQADGTTPMNLTVEVSRRQASQDLVHDHVVERPLSAPLAAAAGGIDPESVRVNVLDSQAIAVTKVMALTSRTRLAVRDLYDLHLLIAAEVASPAPLLASLEGAEARLTEAMDELWPKLEGMTYDQFRSDVATYLPDSVANTITEDAYEDMRLTVGQAVESWLTDALDIARERSGGGPLASPAIGGGVFSSSSAPTNPAVTPPPKNRPKP